MSLSGLGAQDLSTALQLERTGPVRLDRKGRNSCLALNVSFHGPVRLGPVRLDLKGRNSCLALNVSFHGPVRLGPVRLDLKGRNSCLALNVSFSWSCANWARAPGPYRLPDTNGTRGLSQSHL